jgi:hypothetical protein
VKAIGAPSALENEFGWSWSRHEMFYQCARKTYWQYYGFWGGWDAAASEEARLAYRLKQIKSVPMIVGGALHDVVRERLIMRTSPGGPVPAQQIRDEVERRIIKALRESRNRLWEKHNDPKHYAMLFEDYYGPGLEDRERDAAIATAREYAQGMATSVYARRAFAIGKERLRIIDPHDFNQMKIHVDDVLVYAAPDLVVEGDDGAFHVVDWKTGAVRKANVAQLAVYGLYVAEKLGVPLERIIAHIVYLGSGEFQRHENLRDGVAEARRRISTYTADVRSRLTDVERNIAGDIDAFPMTDDRSLCRRCKFQQICGRTGQAPLAPEEDDLVP